VRGALPGGGPGRGSPAPSPAPRGQPAVRPWVLGALLALLVAGCAGLPGGPEAAIEALPAPEWRVGDRWVFRRIALGGATVVVTHRVVSATRDAYAVRVLGLGGEVGRQWTRGLALVQETGSDGSTARYDPPLPLFQWPLRPGQAWSREFAYVDGRRDGRYVNTWRIAAAVEPVDVVAGRFYTVRIERWGDAQRLETYWYNARVRYWVRLEDYLRGYVEELVEFGSWGG
jgi:hypothetical protein